MPGRPPGVRTALPGGGSELSSGQAVLASINAEWIYPPLDEADTILRHADHRRTWPTATVGQSA